MPPKLLLNYSQRNSKETRTDTRAILTLSCIAIVCKTLILRFMQSKDKQHQKTVVSEQTVVIPRTRLSKTSAAHWQVQHVPDSVIAEEPLAIYLHWHEEAKGDCQTLFSITMRTPGDDVNLAIGLLHAEGVIRSLDDIATIEYQDSASQDELLQQNQLDVHFKNGHVPNHQLFQRQTASHSSCGVCGKTSIKAIELSLQGELSDTPNWLSVDILATLPDIVRQLQTLFEQTGGVHAAGIFDARGDLIVLKEDVGRHNALDKALGHALSEPCNLSQAVAVLSGRISFELVQKCVLAGVPVIAAVGAPSSLAIKTAIRFNLTLIGFCHRQTMNVYHGDWRLKK